MKNVWIVISLVCLLALVLTVRAALAAPTTLPQASQFSAISQQGLTATPVSSQPVPITPAATIISTSTQQGQGWLTTVTPSGQGMGMHGGMMGGRTSGRSMHGPIGKGRMRGGGMMAGSESYVTHEIMMTGMTPMHDDVAMQLGMSIEELYHQMAIGKSMVQLAAEKGITEQQLMDGIMAGRKAAFSQAVDAGHMTQVQADSMLINIENNLKMMINGQGTGSTGWGMMWGTKLTP